MSTRTVGLFQIVLSAICFGFLGFFGKKAFAKEVSPFELLSLRFMVSGFLMILGLGAFTRKLKSLGPRQILTGVLLGVGAYAVFSSFYFLAVRGLSMSLAVLLLYTYPLMVALGAWILLKEPIPRSKIAVIPLCFVGTAMLIWGDFQIQNIQSLLFGIAAAIAYALYILGSAKWLREMDTLSASAIIQFSAGLVLFFIGYRELDRAVAVFEIARFEIFGLAIVCSILPITLFQLGLKHVRGWEASIFSTLEPITAILVGVLVLGENFSALQGAGTLVVFTSLIWVAWPSR